MTETAAPRESPLGRHLGFGPIEADTDRAVQRLVIAPHHANPTGSIHGGTFIALADNLATFAAVRANAGGPNDGKFMLVIDLHATILRNQTGGTVEAEARVVRAGRRVTVIRTVIRGDDGKALAEVTTTHIPS